VAIKDDIEMLRSHGRVSFRDLMKICKRHFGEPRNSGSSHNIFKMPWKGNPRINIQRDGKDAKQYQVKDVIKALEKLMEVNDGIGKV